MSKVSIFCVPLVKGNFVAKNKYSGEIETQRCGYFNLNELKTFEEILRLPRVYEKINHLPNFDKTITFHTSISLYSLSSLYKCQEEIPLGIKEVYIVYPGIEDINNMKFPPPLEIIPGKTPIILIDVDGVISGGNGSTNEIKIMGKSQSRTIIYNPAVINRINSWANFAEIRFLTSWGDNATYRLANNIGLYSFNHHYSPKELYLNEDDLKRPIIWIDDEFIYDFLFKDALEMLKLKATNSVHIVSVPEGLLEIHMDAIEYDIGLNRSPEMKTKMLKTLDNLYKENRKNEKLETNLNINYYKTLLE